ncbi:SRPBCC family protein [Streptomyces sp. NPDC005876]|jgi:uncharacterized membrane protein|uniref:SRPBCC family protein n=1 Tax=unclassified Streptomyces TaxID=2593676 RepID=UPI0033C2E01B
MSTIEETAEIAVPVRTAYNQWTQFEVFPRFMSAVRSVEQVRPAVTHWVIGTGPLRHEFRTEIVEQRPDAYVAWRSLDGRHRGEVTFHATAPERTSVTVRIRTRRRGPVGLLVGASGLAHRLVRTELAHFKEYIEGQGEESGAWRGTIRNGHVQPPHPHPPERRVPHWPVG